MHATVWEAIARSAVRHGSNPAIYDATQERSISYEQLVLDVGAASRQMFANDVRPGQRVGLVAGNSYEWIVAYFALWRLRCIPVLISTRCAFEEFAYFVSAAAPSALIYEPRVFGRDIQKYVDGYVRAHHEASSWPVLELSRLVAPAGPQSSAIESDIQRALRNGSSRDAVILFTSGSSGRPKGAMLHHDGLLTSVRNHSGRLCLQPGDRWLSAMPFFHLGGSVWGLLSCLLTGAELTFLRRFDAEQCLWLMEHRDITVHFAVETMLRDELECLRTRRRATPGLRLCTGGSGAEFREEVRSKLRADHLVGMYGLTEAHGNLTATGPCDSRWAQTHTFGRGYPGIEMQIHDADSGARLGPAAEGELWVRGAVVMSGYCNTEEQPIDDEGWLRTGDICSIDEFGYLRFAGRKGEKVRVGGENVSLTEVEEQLRAHPLIVDAYAIGTPDVRLGEVISAAVQITSGTPWTAEQVAALDRWLWSRLADFKRPRNWIRVEEWPRGNSGRVSRSALQSMLSNESASDRIITPKPDRGHEGAVSGSHVEAQDY